MNEQKRISDWLTIAGAESPCEPKFPQSDNFQLALGLILEELIEAAESGSDKQATHFLREASDAIVQARIKVLNRGRVEGDVGELRDACADMRVVLGNLIHFTGIKDKFSEDLNEVMNSNFSKFCTTEQEASDSVAAYAKGTHPNKMGDVIECYHKHVGGYWIIRRKKDNKILKSIKFSEPNFK